jgi:cytidylate kinase
VAVVRRVYWIGGASGGGKSTIARRLAEKHGLRLWSTDEAMPDHARRSTPADAPFLARFIAMSMDERWLSRSPETMLETFHWYRGEAFDLIVEDLRRLPPGPDIVVEGLRLLPHLVAPLPGATGRAVWLLPTPEFRRAAIASRGPASWSFLGRTSDPERARRTLLERERLFTDRLRAETARLGLPALDVDVAMTEDDLTARVAAALGLGW